MLKELEYPFDPSFILKKKKSIKRSLLSDENINNKRIKKNIAILGGGTTNDIKLLLELFLLNYGIDPHFYESEYNSYYEDAVFENETLSKFKPDIIYICTSVRNISSFPNLKNTKEEVDSLLDIEFTKYTHIWNSLKEKYDVPIL